MLARLLPLLLAGQALAQECKATCSSMSCDDWIEEYAHDPSMDVTCESLTDVGCDCSGCAKCIIPAAAPRRQLEPDPLPSPSASPSPSPDASPSPSPSPDELPSASPEGDVLDAEADEHVVVQTISFEFAVTVAAGTDMALLDAEMQVSTLATLNSAMTGGVSLPATALELTSTISSSRRLKSGPRRLSESTSVAYDAAVTMNSEELDLSPEALDAASSAVEDFVNDDTSDGFASELVSTHAASGSSTAAAIESASVTTPASTTTVIIPVDDDEDLTGGGASITDGDDEDKTPIIAGAVAGGVVLIALLGIGCYCMNKNKKAKSNSMPSAKEGMQTVAVAGDSLKSTGI